jgi:hypothetical protein
VGIGLVGNMPREGAIICRDLVGKLAVLHGKCGNSDVYRPDCLNGRYEIDAKLFDNHR